MASEEYDHATIEKKWQARWERDRIFEADTDETKEKFFANFPYPYVNAFSHIGHLYTLMRVETLSRFKRQQGYNVLFPQGWHATGSPIINAAKRVRSREEKQMKIMRDMGFSDEEITKFEDPSYWIDYFVPQYKHDYKRFGMSIDWRRSFHTTSLNPYYDRFIKWQFRTLKEQGFVVKGKFPVVWDPVEKCPIGDHARVEGEGESPQEFTLIKMPLEEDNAKYIMVATLRPETIYGQTNVWCGPDVIYVEAKVKSGDNPEETWIISKPCADKLHEQDKTVTIVQDIAGADLLGKRCFAQGSEHYVPILPSFFCNPNIGTGLVTSVPSDAPDDYMGLYDLQHNEELRESFRIDETLVKDIKPIPIINTPELGDMPAQKLIQDMHIKNQQQRAKLDEAKHIVYKKGYYEGTMTDRCGPYAGLPVQIAKEKVKEQLFHDNNADRLYELTGKVVSRSLTECIVKIVDDQWFLDYNNPEWKKLAHKCLSQMKLYPEKARSQFEYVIDWLHEWACTREEGLGTKLPWDEKWIIESLSDSTIYMAYYTISHMIEDADLEKIDDSFFDYVFLGKGEKPDIEHIDEMRRSFEYWYPVDFRNSGKDLIQNHLTFFIFNHVAIFPEKQWPKGIGVNGWVTVDGQKMSKSLGNMIPLRDMAEEFSVDASRMTILNGGEELDDNNWDTQFAKSIKSKLAVLPSFIKEQYHQYQRTDILQIDRWFESELHRVIRDATASMQETQFRSSIQLIYFEMQRILKHYLKRTNNNPHAELMDEFLWAHVVMLAPFAPHICEEIGEQIGYTGYVSLASWPASDSEKIDESLNRYEAFVGTLLDDIRTVMRLTNIEKPTSISIFISPSWKYDLFGKLDEAFEKGNRDFKSILATLMADENLKRYGKQITKMLPSFLKKGLPSYVPKTQELALLEETKSVVEEEFQTTVHIGDADEAENAKAQQANPGKPAIVLE